MKKQLLALLLAFGIAVTAVGCASANALQTPAAPNPDAVSADSAANVPVPTQPAAPETAPMLTREQAEKIALEYLGFAPDQVSRLRSEFEIDDGLARYDIQFFQGDWEYEFEISAEDGRLLSYDREHKYD